MKSHCRFIKYQIPKKRNERCAIVCTFWTYHQGISYFKIIELMHGKLPFSEHEFLNTSASDRESTLGRMWVKHPIFFNDIILSYKGQTWIWISYVCHCVCRYSFKKCTFFLACIQSSYFSCSGSSSPVVNRDYKCFKFHKHEFSILEGLWSFYLQNIISWRLCTFSELGRMLVCGRIVSWLFKQYPFIKYTCLGVLELHNFLASKFLKLEMWFNVFKYCNNK